jgi:hypothetical protein
MEIAFINLLQIFTGLMCFLSVTMLTKQRLCNKFLFPFILFPIKHSSLFFRQCRYNRCFPFHPLTVYRAFSSGLGPGKQRSAGSKVGTWLTRKRRALSCCAACTRLPPGGQSMQNVYLATEETPGDLLANYRSGHGKR